MESVKHIEKLLDKYLEATTTVAEEERLKAYFNQEEVAPHLESFAPMFRYFELAKQERYTKDLPLKPGRNKLYLQWVSVAAVAVLLIGIFFNHQPQVSPLEEQYTAEELQSAQMALAMFSKNFNKGTDGVSYLKEFEKNTNRFLNND